ncbi:MAG: amidohydrolase family protein [Candidatus Saccharimonas sp.]|nr:amidohydrolase family protein [Planctomycetaceae bacterium]
MSDRFRENPQTKTITGYTERLAAFRAGKSAEELAWQVRTYDTEARLVGIMHKRGVGFLVGTDADLFYAAGFGVHREMELLVAAGLSAADALRAATLNPARALRKTHLFGTVRAGRMADLVLLDANPLQDIRYTRRIRAVVLKGRLVSREELDRMLQVSASRP